MRVVLTNHKRGNILNEKQMNDIKHLNLGESYEYIINHLSAMIHTMNGTFNLYSESQ